jgi:copper chaperone CopZ
MNTMKQSGKKDTAIITTVAAIILSSLIAATAQQKSSCGLQAAQQSKSSAAPIFCPAKSNGQLCGHGTADRLNLEGSSRERWNALVRRYNAQVESAQKQLIEEARSFLTPEQARQVESFFAPASSRAAAVQSDATNKPGAATIKVTGMTCDGCAKSIEQALDKLAGVHKAKVSYERGIAEITYDSSKVTLDQIRATIREVGFGVEEDNAPQAARGSKAAAGRSVSVPVSFYAVPLVCGAAPEIGCGSRAKPILQALERHQAVAGAWLNRSGTVIAVVWAERSTPDERAQAIAATAEKSGLSIQELTEDERESALKEFASRANWYRSSEVDRLSEEEAKIVGARLARRVRAKITLSEKQADELERALSDAFRLCILDPSKRRSLEEELLAAGRRHLDEKGIVALKEALLSGYRPLAGEK